jgi:hypothetical protein
MDISVVVAALPSPSALATVRSWGVHTCEALGQLLNARSGAELALRSRVCPTREALRDLRHLLESCVLCDRKGLLALADALAAGDRQAVLELEALRTGRQWQHARLLSFNVPTVTDELPLFILAWMQLWGFGGLACNPTSACELFRALSCTHRYAKFYCSWCVSVGLGTAQNEAEARVGFLELSDAGFTQATLFLALVDRAKSEPSTPQPPPLEPKAVQHAEPANLVADQRHQEAGVRFDVFVGNLHPLVTEEQLRTEVMS